MKKKKNSNPRIAGFSLAFPLLNEGALSGDNVEKSIHKIQKLLIRNRFELYVSETIVLSLMKPANYQLFDFQVCATDIITSLLNEEIDILWALSPGFGAYQVTLFLEKLNNDKTSVYYKWVEKASSKIIILPPEATVLQNFLHNNIPCQIIRGQPLTFALDEDFDEKIFLMLRNTLKELTFDEGNGLKLLNFNILPNKNEVIKGRIHGGCMDIIYLDGGLFSLENTNENNILFFDVTGLKQWPYFNNNKDIFLTLEKLKQDNLLNNVSAIIFGDILAPLVWPLKPEDLSIELYNTICQKLEMTAVEEFYQLHPDFDFIIREAYKLVSYIHDRKQRGKKSDETKQNISDYTIKVAEFFKKQLEIFTSNLDKFAQNVSIPILMGLKSRAHNNLLLSYENKKHGVDADYQKIKPIFFDGKAELKLSRNPRLKISCSVESDKINDFLTSRREYMKLHKFQEKSFQPRKFIKSTKTLHDHDLIGIQPANNIAHGLEAIEGELIFGHFNDLFHALLSGHLDFEGKHVFVREDDSVAASPFRYALLNMQLGYLQSLHAFKDIKSLTIDFVDESESDENRKALEEDFKEFLYNFSEMNNYKFPIYIIGQSSLKKIKGILHGNINIQFPPLAHYLTSLTYNDCTKEYQEFLRLLNRHITRIRGNFTDQQKKEIAEMQIEENQPRLTKNGLKWLGKLKLVTGYLNKFYNHKELQENARNFVFTYVKHISANNNNLPLVKLKLKNLPSGSLHHPTNSYRQNPIAKIG